MTRKKTTDDNSQGSLLAAPDSASDEGQVAAVSFGDAMTELEGILRRIEEEETDIDQLASELRRATTLLEAARGQLRKAEVEVTQIVQTLESSPSPASAPARDEPEPEDEEDDDGDDIPF